MTYDVVLRDESESLGYVLVVDKGFCEFVEAGFCFCAAGLGGLALAWWWFGGACLSGVDGVADSELEGCCSGCGDEARGEQNGRDEECKAHLEHLIEGLQIKDGRRVVMSGSYGP